MEAIHHAKNLLRKELKKRLKSLSEPEKVRQSLYITKKLMEHPAYQKSQRISVYLAMKKEEVDTDGILRKMFSQNKLCYVPQYIGPKMNMMKMSSMEDYEALPETKWKIKQPADDDVREDALKTGGLDLIIIPGLGFSKEGHRLGRGKGYYDIYQNRCVEETGVKPVTIALAFKEQICESIPITENDVTIDYVLYGDMDD
ncbi:5-formyltetrahydrofolate cyclo-ligase [Strongylocentrotus purpuratus]|uniref:5-formyltetrahydrofolate cyclo-ligase n=1 Tax=Strongylocentrotus purpuratus TaxID=7668 RepID=A0A7M7G3S7_STRPU|nr:5-formyltetrahydrofolate cyclo-ligase [Strongylocentrotus purpuratus]|eukprot:XP_001183516.2 PREDICTED: 5-formyltetrahydrofolate cyclo-ligase [Strongylocentrotus purpuratus]